MKKLIFTLSLLVFTLSVSAQTSLFSYSSAWKYKDDGSDQGTAWTAPSFVDGAWSSGPGQFGYGDGDEATLLNACGTVVANPSCTNKYITYYFRKTINITNVNAFTNYIFNFRRDDGIVIYVNGVELYRENMPSGTITYTTISSSNCSDDGGTIFSNKYTPANSKLVSGANTIAVEIHQTSGSSSDMSFEMELLGETPGVGATLTRGPYIQNVTSNSAILRWRTNNAVNSVVKYGTEANKLNDSVVVSGTRTEHTVNLTGLKDYTRYYYSVGNSAGSIQGDTDNYITTTPVSGKEGKYTFWVTGDCGNNSTNQQQVLSRYNSYIGSKLTDGWLLLGDNAYNSGTDGEFASNFFNIYQKTIMKHASLWPTPGNHDYANDGTRQDDHNIPYYSIFEMPVNGEAGGVASNTEAYYSYDYGNIHFLSLDSYGEESNTRLYDTLGAQVTWIKKDLAANKLPWVIAYWHHPPYTMASHNSDNESELVLMRTNFIKILERNGVDMILCGHSHGYERSKLMKGHYGNESSFNSTAHNVSQSSAVYNGSSNSCPYIKDSLHKTGTVYVVAGSSGSLGGQQSTYPHNAMHTSDVTNGGSLVLQVEGSRLDLKWLCADGVIRDKFTYMKEAGKKKIYELNLGDTAVLEASWNGKYKWNLTSDTTKTTVIRPLESNTYIAKDQYNCIVDTFDVTVIKSLVDFNSPVANTWCAGSAISLPFTTNGTFFDGNIFTAEMSDASGDFSNARVIGQVAANNSDTINAMLPAAGIIADGASYRIRIVSSLPLLSDTTAISNAFSITNNIPSVSLSSSDADNSICKGTPVTFTATGSNSYQFLLNGIPTGSVDSTSKYTSTMLSNQQSIRVTSNNICGADTSAAIMTTVINPPAVSLVSNDADNTICQGQSINFTAGGADNFEFFIGTVSYGFGTVNSVKVENLGNGQQVKVIGYNTCGVDTSELITVAVNPLPTVILSSNDADNMIFENESVSFTAAGASKYQFFINGQSQGAESTTATFSSSSLKNGQTIQAKGSSTDGCVNSSNSITMKVNKRLSINGVNAENINTMVYPNPYNTGGTLTVKYLLNSSSDVSIDMLDINGKVVLKQVISNQSAGEHDEILNLQNTGITQGIYFIKIASTDYTDIIKLCVLSND